MTTSVQNNNSVSSSLLATMNGTGSSTSSSTSGSASDIQNRFLTLLVTQMKNQDPLNPMDNSQVTSQMAQLSTVSGISQLNTTVNSLLSNFQSDQTYQASNLIGHSVLINGDKLSLSGGSGSFGINMGSSASNVTVTISDSSGAAVRTISLGAEKAGVVPSSWDGVKDDGTQAPDGQYTFSVTATNNGQAVTASPLAMDQVKSISSSATGVTLNLSSLGTTTTSQVQQIY